MIRHIVLRRSLALSLLLVAQGPVGAQQPVADSAHSLLTALAGIHLSGYVETSYSISTHPADSAIVGRLYDRFNDQFMLNALKLSLDKSVDSTKLDAGFHTDILFGQNATPIRSAGLALGAQGDLTQLYVLLNVPTANGHGVQFKVGKMVSLLGVETLDPPNNPVWSLGYQAVLLENATSTGLDVNYRFNQHVEAEVRLVNGEDKVRATAGHRSVAAQWRITPDSASYIALLGYVGPQEPRSWADRYGFQGIVRRTLTTMLTAWIQGDYGRESANYALPDSTRDATWWALGGWLSYDLRPKATVGMRADYLNDAQGSRTSGTFGFPANVGQRVGSGTVTLTIRSWPNVALRPELRYDRSNLAAFGGHNDQMTVSMSVNYLY
ncbi:hypothetical protein BH09GEM1_BH09GEM1_45420 [soil metagenome]